MQRPPSQAGPKGEEEIRRRVQLSEMEAEAYSPQTK